MIFLTDVLFLGKIATVCFLVRSVVVILSAMVYKCVQRKKKLSVIIGTVSFEL